MAEPRVLRLSRAWDCDEQKKAEISRNSSGEILAAQFVEWEQNEGCHYGGAWGELNPQFVGLEAWSADEADESWPSPVPGRSLLLPQSKNIPIRYFAAPAGKTEPSWTGSSLGKVAGWAGEAGRKCRAIWQKVLKFYYCVSFWIDGFVRAVTLAACCSYCICSLWCLQWVKKLLRFKWLHLIEG